MTINYVGKRAFKNRFAEFSYTDEEHDKFLEVASILESEGYTVDASVENWAAVEVEDRNEYDDLKRIYKRAKAAV